MSESEFIENGCDEENEDQTWYPSESAIEDLEQGKAKRNEYKESLKQGHFVPHPVDLCLIQVLKF